MIVTVSVTVNSELLQNLVPSKQMQLCFSALRDNRYMEKHDSEGLNPSMLQPDNQIYTKKEIKLKNCKPTL
jgi:hypothetical protein